MPILRPKKIIYGAEDMEAGVRCFEDWGLELVESGDTGADFKTAENQHLILRKKLDPDLPAMPNDGPTVHAVIWEGARC